MNSKPANSYWLWCPALLVLLFQLVPDFVQYDRQAPFEFWRFYTSHFVHWDLNHLLWDLLLFIVLAYMLIKEDYQLFKLNLFIAPWVISLVLFITQPNMLYYRGISGLDAALFTSLACLWIKKGNNTFRIIGIIQLVLLSAKIIFEFISHEAVFASSQTFVVMPWAHLAGALSASFLVQCKASLLAIEKITFKHRNEKKAPQIKSIDT